MSKFYSGKSIKEVKTGNILDFLNSHKVSSKTRIVLNKKAFNLLFDRAVIDEVVGQFDRPLFPEIVRDEAEIKDYFTKNELEVFFDESNLDKFLKNATNNKVKESRGAY